MARFVEWDVAGVVGCRGGVEYGWRVILSSS